MIKFFFIYYKTTDDEYFMYPEIFDTFALAQIQCDRLLNRGVTAFVGTLVL